MSPCGPKGHYHGGVSLLRMPSVTARRIDHDVTRDINHNEDDDRIAALRHYERVSAKVSTAEGRRIADLYISAIRVDNAIDRVNFFDERVRDDIDRTEAFVAFVVHIEFARCSG